MTRRRSLSRKFARCDRRTSVVLEHKSVDGQTLLVEPGLYSDPASIRARLLYEEIRYCHTSSKHHSHHYPSIVPST